MNWISQAGQIDTFFCHMILVGIADSHVDCHKNNFGFLPADDSGAYGWFCGFTTSHQTMNRFDQVVSQNLPVVAALQDLHAQGEQIVMTTSRYALLNLSHKKSSGQDQDASWEFESNLQADE